MAETNEKLPIKLTTHSNKWPIQLTALKENAANSEGAEEGYRKIDFTLSGHGGHEVSLGLGLIIGMGMAGAVIQAFKTNPFYACLMLGAAAAVLNQATKLMYYGTDLYKFGEILKSNNTRPEEIQFQQPEIKVTIDPKKSDNDLYGIHKRMTGSISISEKKLERDASARKMEPHLAAFEVATELLKAAGRDFHEKNFYPVQGEIGRGI